MKDLLKSQTHHYVLSGLLALFIVLDIKVPSEAKPLINSIVGKAVIILSTLSLLSINMLVGVLAVIASFELLKRSGSSVSIPEFIPKFPVFNNDSEDTSKIAGNTAAPLPSLEENVIDNMLPRTASDAFDSAPFKPVQNSVHGAGKL